MRFLHTSDWHIGKKLEERPRLDEQRAVLYSLVDIARDRKVDIVLVAGDVFDTFTPSAEAERVFYDTLYALLNVCSAVVVISGNHDDGVRLSATRELTKKSGVFFSGTAAYSRKDLGTVTLTEGNGDHLVFEKQGEKVYIAMLPYPNEALLNSFSGEDADYEQKVAYYIRKSLSENIEGLPVVLVGHVFMRGGVSGESERQIELGGARLVGREAIPDNVIYTALGHLHRRQVVSAERNIIYSGSILQNAFDECGFDKSVTVFDVNFGKVENLEVVELKNYLKLKRITAKSFGEAMQSLSGLEDTFVEVTLDLSAPHTREDVKNLVTAYPKAILRINIAGGEKVAAVKRLMTSEELFKAYYKSRYGSDADGDILGLFLELINEAEGDYET